ncbi:FAD-binding oxidoreductase [Pontibacter sp. E15-1]|uniref:FAD-binding oxidoreductase n=1 Tax=Pontibacter sp. E15-1 TaxID=2919918 RepID=UPI001F4F6354|nr:FAD-binding oxidoreductase [Pontibacter sp. E15-1]MCJ8163396.1 FAD-binding oxidoreductase [Pontibacter sp. E15-1]
MSTYATGSLGGATSKISEQDLSHFRDSLHGDLLTPTSEKYDEVRTVWNDMIDRHPSMIARCTTAEDVMHAVSFANWHKLLVAVRGGGHNIAGNAVCDDGLMIDLQQMRQVRIDPNAKIAHVEPGCTLADFDREAQAFGLATPTGINSTTGVAGLTLGGGFGWLSRKYGLTVDSLLSAEVVTAEGKLLHASKDENQDLFWAIRGGGGNFGVVTSFEFALHPVGPEVLSGLLIHPLQDAKNVLQHYRECVATFPDETSVWVVLRKAPPLPFIPEEWHGKEVVILAAFHAGEMSEGERILEPLRKFGNPIADVIGPHQYAEWQQAFDPLLTPGARNYWKSHNFEKLDEALLDLLIVSTQNLPSPLTEIFIGQMGGQTNRIASTDTAYPHRDANFVMNLHGRWEDPSDDKKVTDWARELFNAAAPYATGGVYVNFLTGEESNRIRLAYGPNYDRLVKIKTKYDPNNLFRYNQNVRPDTES